MYLRNIIGTFFLNVLFIKHEVTFSPIQDQFSLTCHMHIPFKENLIHSSVTTHHANLLFYTTCGRNK